MDHRTLLKQGTQLAFPGMRCTVGALVGKGSNAVVYEGFYDDETSAARHHVLIKELFPYASDGQIWRSEQGAVCYTDEIGAVWALHRRSFERGNDVHLHMLRLRPDVIGGNLNTYALNGTLYTILDYSGGRSLDKELHTGALPDLRTTIIRMMQLLDVLSIFHQNGYLHLDISLDNILLIGSGSLERVSLIDFNSIHTREELAGGLDIYFSEKEGFTAPEVRTRNHKRIGFSTDLYAAASVFFSCLTGRTLTYDELNEQTAPSAEESPLLQDIPLTARAQVQKILYRGLHILTKRRYQSCEEMRADLEELLNRLDSRGVTHAALWEAGRKNARQLMKQNPSLAYLAVETSLYPLAVQIGEDEIVPAEGFMKNAAASRQSFLLLGEGGVGKSTLLMRTALTTPDRYAETDAAVMYVPLMHWHEGARNFVLDSILMGLRFDAQTSTMDAARQALYQLLANPAERKDGKTGQVLLLLDGLNEAQGDTAELVEEINRLSALPGVCIIVSGRTADEKLLLPHAQMVPLSDETVGAALAAHGLLEPEEAAVKELLRIPMMLSMYISTAQGEETQVQCHTGDELLRRYLSALCTRRTDTKTSQCRAEAAVWLVLPAIASEIVRSRHALTDTELQKVAARCYRVLHSRNLTRAFPQWIGHRNEILMAQDADAWYGAVVQQLLWKQLGLLMVENGAYHLPHQIIQDYLLGVHAQNQKLLRGRKQMAAAAAAAAVTAVLIALLGIYNTWIRKLPYTDAYAETVFTHASICYVNVMENARWMYDLVHDAQNDGRPCMNVYKPGGTVLLYMATLVKEHSHGASALPWTIGPLPWQVGSSFTLEDCQILLDMPEYQARHYADIIKGWEALAGTDDPARRQNYLDAVDQYLIAQQEYAQLMNQTVCVPYEKDFPDQAGYALGLSGVTAAQISSGSQNGSASVSLDARLQGADDRCAVAWVRIARLLGELGILVETD